MADEDEDAIIKQAMSLIGRRTSEKKKQSSAENGKKGGRPRKAAPDADADAQSAAKPGKSARNGK